MTANPTWIDQFIFGLKSILIGGVALPPRPAINFLGGGVSGVDNPAAGTTDLTIVIPPNLAPFGPPGKLVRPPTAVSFTARNPVGGGVGATSLATIQEHPSGYGIAIYGTQSSAHECFNGIFKTRGSNTTLIVQVDAPYWDSSPDGSVLAPPFGGLVVYSPANNKALIWGPYAGNTPAVGQGNGLYLFHQNIAGASTASSFALLPAKPTFPIWLKWHDDGANYNFSYSFDGEFTNAPTVSESRTAFLADAGTEVGVACAAIQGSGTRTNVKAASLWLGSWNLN